jgi:hypothetical protein
MAAKTTFTCDVCKKPSNPNRHICINLLTQNEYFDLCSQCLDFLLIWLSTGKK